MEIPVKNRVAIYARVSTHLQTCENQILDLENFCTQRGWTIKARFIDDDISGTKEDRPQLNEMMRLIRARKFDALLVWRLDRFARSMNFLVMTIEELKGLKVDFISYQENIDTSTSQGMLMFHIMGGLAQFERALICERVMAGLRRAKAHGKKFGRPTIPEMKKKEILDYRGFYSSRKIAELTGISSATVKRVLAQKPIEKSYPPTDEPIIQKS